MQSDFERDNRSLILVGERGKEREGMAIPFVYTVPTELLYMFYLYLFGPINMQSSGLKKLVVVRNDSRFT